MAEEPDGPAAWQFVACRNARAAARLVAYYQHVALRVHFLGEQVGCAEHVAVGEYNGRAGVNNALCRLYVDGLFVR